MDNLFLLLASKSCQYSFFQMAFKTQNVVQMALKWLFLLKKSQKFASDRGLLTDPRLWCTRVVPVCSARRVNESSFKRKIYLLVQNPSPLSKILFARLCWPWLWFYVCLSAGLMVYFWIARRGCDLSSSKQSLWKIHVAYSLLACLVFDINMRLWKAVTACCCLQKRTGGTRKLKIQLVFFY